MKLINWKDDFLKRVVIIGAGASGMLAAKVASDRGYKVIVLEKQKRCGQKLLITGKGRCNITNNCEIEELIENVPTNGKFLYSAFYTFTNDQVIDMFNDLGVETKTERGKRVFPVSDKAVDVVRALEKQMRSNKNVEVLLNSKVDKIEAQDGKVKKVILSDKREIECDSVIVATGGVSYPRTGSSGDGYKFARNLGHTIIKPKASLIGLEVMEDYVTDLAKLSLRNVSINVYNSKNKKIYDDFGEMEFTKYGLDGPIIKSASCRMGDLSKENYKIVLDLKPALTIKAQIAMLHYLTKGASLGYGLTYKVNRDSVIAVIPIGYGDGLPRILSSNGSVLIKGQKCPIVGRICMDQMLVDVSEISDISDNDLVTVIGQDGTEEIRVEEIALEANTISNEILSRLGSRLPRIYRGG